VVVVEEVKVAAGALELRWTRPQESLACGSTLRRIRKRTKHAYILARNKVDKVTNITT
jgi:hypothetical protein